MARGKTSVKLDLEKQFSGQIIAHVFDDRGELQASQPVKGSQLDLPIDEATARRSRIFLAPEQPPGAKPTLAAMERIGGHELSLASGMSGPLAQTVAVPASIIDRWLLCLCVVKGRVVRPVGTGGSMQDRPVCGARVHICEVDRWPLIIAQLADHEILRLRDDLVEAMTKPPKPIPDPGPLRRFLPRPLPELLPTQPKSALRFEDPASLVGFNPQPEPPSPALLRDAHGDASASVGQTLQTRAASIESKSLNVPAALRASATTELRRALIANIDLLRLHICLWPWWWGFFRCDEIAVVETDALGRFQTLIFYACSGDKPDLYFWVEYFIGGTWQTVYHPAIACNTYWNYPCGSQVTIRVTDPRVPACGGDPDLGGLQVAVMSIGNGVSVKEIQGAGAGASEGLTTSGAPFGGTLEPHVWFSRTNLIAAGITHYRWSARRLTGPDGVAPAVGPWSILTREVGRHYAVMSGTDLSFPFEVLGPDAAQLFRIQPGSPPAPGIDWSELDAREDTATAFFETTKLPHGLPGTPSDCQKAEQTAGKYEMKLELFHADGSLVDWTAEGVALRIADDPAPFGTGTVHTIDAPGYYRIINGASHLVGYRMVVRVDNNCCAANILPVTGPGLTVDVDCGFIEYTPGATGLVRFDARHPHDFATFSFHVRRGFGPVIPEATTGGVAGAASTAAAGGPFLEGPPFRYTKAIPVSTLLTSQTPPGGTPCDRAAFAENLYVAAMATDGWSRLNYLDRSDAAAFALSTPCDC